MKWHEAPLLPLAAAFALGIYSSSWAAVPTSWLLGAGGLLLVLTAITLAFGADRVATGGLIVLRSARAALPPASDPLPRAPAPPGRPQRAGRAGTARQRGRAPGRRAGALDGGPDPAPHRRRRPERR